MTQEELRKYCKKYFTCESIQHCIELLDIYAELFFQTVNNHHYDKVQSHAHGEAKIILQMMMTKVLTLKNVLLGAEFHSKTGKSLNKIIDPTIIASLIRNIYETTGMFNLIFRQTKNDDELKLLYLLWVHAGLSYRQRFDEVSTSVENKEKAEAEKKQIEEIKKRIEELELYKQFDEKNKNKIQTKLRQKDYLIKIENNEVVFLAWKDLVNIMGIKNEKLDHLYTYFSLYSHPSNVSVFQFANMFEKGKEAYPDLVIFNLLTAFYLLSIFTADFINLFPETLKTFEKLNLGDQIVINFHNSLIRGHEFDINEAWKATG